MQLVVGRIGRAHGIKGEVTVEVRTDEPELRLAPGAVLHTDPSTVGPLTITSGREHSGRLLLCFEGTRDRNAAEALRGTLLVADVDPDDEPADAEEFYDHQLVGADVVATDGQVLGQVAELVHLPHQDLLSVRRTDGGEALVPFVSEIVLNVDVEERRMTVDPPAGLFDLGTT